jgi:hypothetical protein
MISKKEVVWLWGTPFFLYVFFALEGNSQLKIVKYV